jgi:hypothetical protein
MLSIPTFSSVDFVSLKSLHLKRVCFDQRWFLFELLNGCPVLKNFEAEALSVAISSLSNFPDRVLKHLPKLVRANISNLYVYNFPLKPFCGVESLRLVEVIYVLNLLFINNYIIL